MKSSAVVTAKSVSAGRDIRVLLHDIRSVHNVGSMFRTSDAAGVSHLYLSGYTPTPVDRFKRPRKDLAKVALGAEQNIQWTALSAEVSPTILIKSLKKEGFTVVAVEQDARAVDYKTVAASSTVSDKNAKVLLIFGNEVDGVSKDLLALCDVVAEIPMAGQKESLNVAVSFGIALFRLLGL